MEEFCNKHTTESCQKVMLPIQDALELLSGKWKIPIIVALINDVKRFSDLSREIPRITDRMLSKELRSLEMNQLVKRTVYDTFPVTVEYTMTEYGHSLRPVIEALAQWGTKHREKIMQD
ncbi:winged helix-turn-helix transcriptional regulator [Reichenbachiella ulvae]|uniref:Helix-turn-helix transcriptional regulator n=1 Tax=Reichenbachiella ulvae TaxID=2980104 RepID=A0ABT3CQH4_9BACT|nr:helix-turn-helix domain-containing protein [Reichenbachiella ulvae]MCV9385955.1 helix-turn-helix transcriptional regulator [Reichenbachiella ulvae]